MKHLSLYIIIGVMFLGVFGFFYFYDFQDVNIQDSPGDSTIKGIINWAIWQTYGDVVFETHGVSVDSGDTFTQLRGMEFSTNTSGVELQKVGIQTLSTATKAYIRDSSGEILVTADITNLNATFNYELLANTVYSVVVDKEGSSYNSRFDNVGASYPIQSGNITWIGGIVTNSSDNKMREILGFTLKEMIGGVTLNSPNNNSIFNFNSIGFNATAKHTATIVNASLWLNESGSFIPVNSTTGLSGTEVGINLNHTFSSDGSYSWNMEFCDTDGNCSVSNSNRTIVIDTTSPTINITYPTNNVGYNIKGVNTTLNWTVTDLNLASCWYEYNNTNTTVTCANNNVSINFSNYDQRTINFWANDSGGNKINFSRTWIYKLWEEIQGYSNSTTEGATERFEINVTLATGRQISTINLIYNDTDSVTSNSGTITNPSGNNYTIYKNHEIPSTDIIKNNTFFWEITLDDATKINTSANLQQVSTLTIDNCSANANKLYNFSLIDERTQIEFNAITHNASGKVNMQLYSVDRSLNIANFTATNNNSGSYQVCLSTDLSGSEQYSVDLQLQYDADMYANEFYHIQNATISSATLGTNITLYDLEDAKDQEFVITYKDSSFLPVSDALVQVQRKYIDEGVFKTVEIPITDVGGETIAHLELADAVYTFVVVKQGEVLGTFENVLAVCQDIVLGNCDINLNSVVSDTVSTDFTTFDDLTLTLTYDQDTRVLQSVFTVPSGTPKTMVLNATVYDNLGNTQICSDTLTSSSGTLSCTAPITFGNGSMSVIIISDGDIVAKTITKMQKTNRDIYGASIMFLTIFLYLTLIGVGISDNPMVTSFFILLGVILAIGLNLVSTNAFVGKGATVLWIFIIIALLFIKGGKRS